MPSLRAPVLRPGLQPSARLLPHTTRPFVTTQIRQETRNEKLYEPNDGGKGTAYTQPGNKAPAGGAKTDGTGGAVNSNKSLIMIGASTAAIGVAYFYLTGKPDKPVAESLKRDTDAVKRMTGSDRQRQGGPERSAK